MGYPIIEQIAAGDRVPSARLPGSRAVRRFS